MVSNAVIQQKETAMDTHQSSLPTTGFLRLKQILGDKKSGTPPIIPVSRAAWYLGIKKGIYPAPQYLGERTAVYRVEDIIALVGKLGQRDEEGANGRG